MKIDQATKDAVIEAATKSTAWKTVGNEHHTEVEHDYETYLVSVHTSGSVLASVDYTNGYGGGPGGRFGATATRDQHRNILKAARA